MPRRRRLHARTRIVHTEAMPRVYIFKPLSVVLKIRKERRKLPAGYAPVYYHC